MKHYYIRKPLILLLIIINILLLNGNIVFAEETKKNHILVLNSYHKGYAWTDNIVKGIESVLKDENNVIRIEYMDTKMIQDERQLNNLYEFYKYKFSNYKFDVIISSDNYAYNFIKKYHEELFKDTPVVCCGLNAYDDFISNNDNLFTGIAEIVDIKDTLDIALKLHPNSKNVIFITRDDLSANMICETIKNEASVYKGKLKFDFIQSDSIDKVINYIKTRPRESIIFQASLYKDKFGGFIPTEKGNKIISEAVDLPIYSCWEMFLGNGVIGGGMVSGYYHGQTAANMALQILSGRNVKDVPFIKKSTNRYIFDYDSMKKYNIKKSDLPKDSIVKNTPSFVLEVEKSYVYFCMILIVILLICINFILFKNILKLRKVEKELIKEKKILRSILDSTADGIIVVDEYGTVIHYNNRVKKMWRIPKELLDRKNSKELINYAKNQIIEPNEFVNRVEGTSEISTNNVDIYNLKDGREFVCVFQPLIIEGKSRGRVWNFRDITKKRELEELEKEVEIKERLLEEAKKYDKMKDQFMATISHELKTPLNIILGTMQLIDKTFCEQKFHVNHDKLKKYVNISKQNCFRLLKLINNLIDITKIDSGYMEINLKNYNIVNVIEDITLSIADYIESKGIELIFDTEIEEKIIACDAEKLERVMLNLFSNAVKFTEAEGSIVVNIYDKGETILISVKDTGIGIPTDMKEKIFNRFRQVDSSLHRKAEGSGIGLALVKSIIEMHNGEITLESELGKGSEFIIELPVVLVDEICDAQEEAAVTIQSNVERISIEFSDIYS